MRILLFSAMVVGVLSGCAGPEDLPPLEQEGPPSKGYRLDTDDLLRITVFNQAQLTGDYRVGADGTISMPLIGEVSARGQTTGELEQTLVKRLSVEKNLLVEPSVNVQIEAYRPFFILGEVRNPGQYPCPYDTTVLSAVAIAGGFTYRAQTDYVSITRRIGSQPAERRASRDSVIQPGDVIYVYERYF
jgi:polysaccharide export outer membrane protein